MIWERALFIVVALAAGVGAATATGIMWYAMVFEAFDYTRESWYAIPLLWGYVLLTLGLAALQRFMGGIAMLYGSYLASTYFADVYGYIPGALIAASAVFLIGQDLLRWVGRAGTVPRSEHA
ncbi:MAG: hypothetical protein HY873_08665 [Chloroflexi bacterium]|nr:hypothetical protein [Chloroflexota bacterium]